MIGLKNFSAKKIVQQFDGVEYSFAPKEIKLVENHVATHLMKSTYTCGIGASPLRTVPLDAIPAEVSADPGALSGDILQLTNETSAGVDLMHDGEIYSIAPKGTRVLPAEIARILYQGHIDARRSGLVLSKVVPPAKEVSAPPPPVEPAPEESAAPDTSELSPTPEATPEEAEAPAPKSPQKRNKK